MRLQLFLEQRLILSVAEGSGAARAEHEESVGKKAREDNRGGEHIHGLILPYVIQDSDCTVSVRLLCKAVHNKPNEKF